MIRIDVMIEVGVLISILAPTYIHMILTLSVLGWSSVMIKRKSQNSPTLPR